jgi:hypothetical protein
MLSAIATPALTESGSQHQYGTRIRSNSVIKPSARLRQSPDPPPRRIKPVPITKAKAQPPNKGPAPVEMPPFPPANVMLHPDDASSKVFLAIGRSFVSVVRRTKFFCLPQHLSHTQDNKAMTIKDLAEMTMKYGLMCQKSVLLNAVPYWSC